MICLLTWAISERFRHEVLCNKALYKSTLLVFLFLFCVTSVIVVWRLMTLMDLEPDNEKVYFNLGMLSMDDRKFEQAKQWFDKAIEVLNNTHSN